MQSTIQKQAVPLKAKLFRGFADSSRLSILETLRSGPMTVSDIVTATGLSQSNVSNHLGCLRDCGLVEVEQQGRYAYYRLNGQQVGQLLSLADELLAEVARGVYECTRYAVREEPDGTNPNN
jgi:ArsR family transcriptional regulator, cadmium/lead-responsive transcriptional repressor